MEGGKKPVCGVNLLVQANDNKGLDALFVKGGISVASTKKGAEADGRYAGENAGAVRVQANLNLHGVTNPLTRKVVALVE